MWYVKKWDIATDATNWLLTNHPDIYLSGAMFYALPFIKDDQRAMIFKQQWMDAKQQLQAIADRDADRDTLDTRDVALLQNQRYSFNVLTGRY
jgi:hypothetical protein